MTHFRSVRLNSKVVSVEWSKKKEFDNKCNPLFFRFVSFSRVAVAASQGGQGGQDGQDMAKTWGKFGDDRHSQKETVGPGNNHVFPVPVMF